MTAALFDTVWELPRKMRAAVQSQFYLSSDCIDSRSPWTGEGTPFDPFVQVFIADITPPAAKSAAHTTDAEVSARDWQGFMTRMRGTSGLMRVVDFYRMRPTYDVRNAPSSLNWSTGATWSDGEQWSVGPLPPFVTFAEAAYENDDSVVLDFGSDFASIELILNPADLIEGRPNGIPTAFGNLYEVVNATRTNADGKTRVYLQPGLRQDFAAGDMMVLRYPTLVARLADKSQGIVTRSLSGVGNLGFKLIEHTRHE
jgi:hypothetical protein